MILIIFALIVTTGFALLFGEKLYPQYRKERRIIRKDLRSVIRDMNKFKSEHSPENIKNNSFFSNQWKEFVQNRKLIQEDLSSMRLRFVGLVVVCGSIIVICWVYALYKLI